MLVPFPGAGAHQSTNARAVQVAGAAVMRLESELKPGELWEVACGLLTDEARRARMARAALERGAPDAAERIAFELLDLAAADPSRPAATDSTERSVVEEER